MALIDSPRSALTNKDFVVIQCSIISPTESNHVADLYGNKSIEMITVPIIGGISLEKGELILVVAGPKKHSMGPSHYLMTSVNKYFMLGQIIAYCKNMPQTRSQH